MRRCQLQRSFQVNCTEKLNQHVNETSELQNFKNSNFFTSLPRKIVKIYVTSIKTEKVCSWTSHRIYFMSQTSAYRSIFVALLNFRSSRFLLYFHARLVIKTFWTFSTKKITLKLLNRSNFRLFNLRIIQNWWTFLPKHFGSILFSNLEKNSRRKISQKKGSGRLGKITGKFIRKTVAIAPRNPHMSGIKNCKKTSNWRKHLRAWNQSSENTETKRDHKN